MSGTDRAVELFEQACAARGRGRYDEAAALFLQSIEVRPTAEAHTFLGWTYASMGRYDAAIAECHKATSVDPEFGNPYNDIGAYLIELGRPDEAVPWLQRANRAARYEAPPMDEGRKDALAAYVAKRKEEIKAGKLLPDVLD